MRREASGGIGTARSLFPYAEFDQEPLYAAWKWFDFL